MKKLDWKVTMALGVIHAIGFVGLTFFWSWEGLVLLLVLYAATALGVTVGYHRYLTHGGFQTYTVVRWILSVLGMLSGEGPPLYWVSFHRKHHKYSDLPDDPHSPRQSGFWHAHVLWLLVFKGSSEFASLFKQYAPDLYKEWFMRFLNRSYVWWQLGLLILLIFGGYLYGGPYYAASFAAYGFFARMALVLHVTWAVNSLSHMWGYRPFQTSDDSRNNWLVALLAFGEGWHNNHHAYPVLARHGFRWWEIDISYWLIRMLQLFHVVWDVKATLPPRS